MEKIRLGRTELHVTKTAFGALPIQRISKADAVKLVRRAYEGGINYFDTANMYTDSEEKLGEALEGVRQNVVISTKSAATDKKTAMAHIEESLRRLRTDYIDLFQFHNPAVLPDINDPDGPFAAALEAKQKGYIRHIGITNHRLAVAHQALTQKKASSRKTETDNEKYAFRCWMLRLGLIGDEFKTCRLHMLKHLAGNSAWRNAA